MLPHPLTKFKIQKGHQSEPKFNGVYSINNLPKIKDGAYIINFGEYQSTGTHFIDVCMNGDNVTYFEVNSFQKKSKKS